MREALKAHLACKVAAICEGSQLANEYLRNRIVARNAIVAARLENYRRKHDLPRCPPVCPDPSDAPVEGEVV